MSKANPSMQIAHTVRLYAVHRSAATCGPAALSNDRRAIESLPSEVLSPQGAAQARLTSPLRLLLQHPAATASMRYIPRGRPAALTPKSHNGRAIREVACA